MEILNYLEKRKEKIIPLLVSPILSLSNDSLLTEQLKTVNVEKKSEQYGEIGKIITGLFHLNNHYEQSSRIGKAGIPPSKKEEIGRDIWLTPNESREIFTNTLKKCLLIIPPKNYKNVPKVLQDVINTSYGIITKESEDFQKVHRAGRITNLLKKEYDKGKNVEKRINVIHNLITGKQLTILKRHNPEHYNIIKKSLNWYDKKNNKK
jgi:hypothetical protein